MTANKDLLLSVDNGTQSLKALIFDLDGQLLACRTVAFSPYFSEHPAWAEQDPDVFWNSLCCACRELFQQYPRFRERIAGMALTTQRATMVNVDKNGKPLRPAILWLDQRKTYGLPPVGGLWGIVFSIAGLRKTVAYLQAEAEANWISTYQPDIWQKTHKLLQVAGPKPQNGSRREAPQSGAAVTMNTVPVTLQPTANANVQRQFIHFASNII